MDYQQQMLLFDRVISLAHECVKIVIIYKIVDAMMNSDDATRQNLSVALGTILSVGPHLNRFQQDY
ncbi:MAG: hypothetical protein JNL74_23285 [Fibrobacteres bacterium]|nr:hypothetical protein [Fibrobacterota bacterium]